MSDGEIWSLCLTIWVLQIVGLYILTLYGEFRKFKNERSSWANKSFAEYIYSDEHPDYENPLLWVQYAPYIGILFGMVNLVSEYGPYLNIKISNPIRAILRVILRKRYLLERVSKEI